MSGQESLQCSTKASLAYTSARPGRKAEVSSSHQKMKNRFLSFVLSFFVYSHFSIVPFSALSLSTWSKTTHLLTATTYCKIRPRAQHPGQGLSHFISERPVPPVAICTDCNILIVHSCPCDHPCDDCPDDLWNLVHLTSIAVAAGWEVRVLLETACLKCRLRHFSRCEGL